MAPKILIIEDEPSIIANISYALTTEGFETFCAATAREGQAILEKENCDCVILDVGLPDQSGFELCKDIRKKSKVPILFLTARSSELDRVVGLEIGADDYIVKPFSPRELTARVRAILRRFQAVPATSKEVFETPKNNQQQTKDTFEIDAERFKIKYYKQALILTRYEYKILCVLIQKPGIVFSRDQLMDQAWDDPLSSFDRTIDAHIKAIRSKLKVIKPDVDPIETHRGIGYSLKENL